MCGNPVTYRTLLNASARKAYATWVAPHKSTFVPHREKTSPNYNSLHMGIEYSPKAKRKARLKSKRANRMPQAGPVTIRKADGTTTVQEALTGSVDQVKKRK